MHLAAINEKRINLLLNKHFLNTTNVVAQVVSFNQKNELDFVNAKMTKMLIDW